MPAHLSPKKSDLFAPQFLLYQTDLITYYSAYLRDLVGINCEVCVKCLISTKSVLNKQIIVIRTNDHCLG